MNPYAQYQEAQFETAPKERLLIMLYDGLIRFNNAAIASLQGGQFQKGHDYCVKIQNILAELMATLNFDVDKEFAQNMFDLYEFLHAQTIQANIRKDPEILTKHHKIYLELREAWVQAAKNIAIEKQQRQSA
jgi:flagellar protein FliS